MECFKTLREPFLEEKWVSKGNGVCGRDPSSCQVVLLLVQACQMWQAADNSQEEWGSAFNPELHFEKCRKDLSFYMIKKLF